MTLRAKPAVAILPVGSSKTDRSRRLQPEEEWCLGEGKCDRDSSDAGSSDMKHSANDARDSS